MMTSIVIATLDSLPYLTRCIESVVRYTKPGTYELIIITQGSPLLVRQYVLTYTRLMEPKLVTVYNNTENVGCARGWNQGIRAAPGDNIVILNDDTVVAPNWLPPLVEAATANPNNIYGSHVLDVHAQYKHIVELDSREWERITTAFSERDKDIRDEGIHGCCFILPKQVIDTVGHFDEGFIKGSWEDVDYVHRVYQAGGKAEVLHSSTIWHYGGATQHYIGQREGRGYQAVNQRFFEKKWGIRTTGYMCSRAILWERLADGTNRKVTAR